MMSHSKTISALNYLAVNPASRVVLGGGQDNGQAGG